jgi:hypothetical protein
VLAEPFVTDHNVAITVSSPSMIKSWIAVISNVTEVDHAGIVTVAVSIM